MTEETHTDTLRSLQALAQQRRTGRLSVSDETGEVAVYLLDGTIVGAWSEDDGRSVVEHLLAQAQIDPTRAQQLLNISPDALAMLRRVPGDPIIGLLVEHVAADTLEKTLVQRFVQNVSRFTRSPARPEFDPDALPWIDNIHVTLLPEPLMRGQAIERSVIVDLDEDLFDIDDASPVPDEAPAAETDATGLSAVEQSDEGLDEEITTEFFHPVFAPETTLAQATSPSDLSPPGPSEDPSTPPTATEPVMTHAHDKPEAPKAPTPGKHVLEDMDAFSGVGDEGRGGGRDGTFVTHMDLLDTVELETQEAAGASPSFAPPKLGEHDALDKLGVVNPILSAFCAALNDQEAGLGTHVLQELINTTPRNYAPLLLGLNIQADGTLQPEALLAALRARPEHEQRHLLREGLLDLLDRAINRVAEELLDEDRLDTVLADTAGYRQRIGI